MFEDEVADFLTRALNVTHSADVDADVREYAFLGFMCVLFAAMLHNTELGRPPVLFTVLHFPQEPWKGGA